MTTHDQLEESTRICDAATAGPWDWGQGAHGLPSNGPDHISVKADRGTVAELDLSYPASHDAIFIAHARAALPQRNAALKAVLELHKPERRWMPYEGAEVSFGTEREALEASHDVDINIVVMEELAKNGAPHFDLCRECKRIEESPCEGECTSEIGYEAALWPCATVRAIEEAGA